MKTEFKHIENITICTITNDNGLVFYGEARCAPEDEDKYSDIIGEEIAEKRAEIQSLRFVREVIRDEIKNETHLINCMKQNKNFSSKHNEFRLLARNLRANEAALEEIHDLIRMNKRILKRYTGHI